MATTFVNTGKKPIESNPTFQETSPEQKKFRMRESQELLHRLQYLLIEGENPGLDIISDTLQKSEEILLQLANQKDIDHISRKTLEDICALLISARQMGRNKGIADRLQKIAMESQKALESSRGADVPVSAAVKEGLEFINNWRPLFYLLVTSRDFRQLLLDSIRIIRGITSRYVLNEETSQKFVEGVPAKEIAKDVKQDVKERAEISDEELDMLLEDLQRVLVLLAKEPTYHEGIERIFTLLDSFQKSVEQNLPAEQSLLPEDIHARRAVTETEEFVASFSGRDTLDEFKFHLRKMVMKFQQNENLRTYISELKEFILLMRSEEEIRSEEFKEKSKDIARRGRSLMQEIKQEEEDDFNLFFEAANQMIENIKNDEFMQLLRYHAGIVQSDLSYVDSEGMVQPDTDRLSKLQDVLLPVLAEALKYIPVPRIYSSDKNREFWLDNIVLCGYDIIPENIRFHLETDSEISFRELQQKETHTYLVIQLDRLLTELKDVHFYYRKKTFPELEDSGVVTFRERGRGGRLTLVYNVYQGSEDFLPKIREGYARFDLSDIEIEFDKSTLKHDVLIPMLTSMFKLQITKQIEFQVEKNLNGWMNKLGEMLMTSLAQVNRPLLSGFEAARKAVKSTQMAQIFEKRREKLE